MKIIDAHFHMFPEGYLNRELLAGVGHEPGFDYLLNYYREHDFVHGVIMSNGPLAAEHHEYPKEFHYCIGLDRVGSNPQNVTDAIPYVEENLKREQCCGVKLYPGYNAISINDPCYEPVYRLAEQYGKPVAVHMGQTAFPQALLKYTHPMEMDEAAVRHPRIQFVMCHFGNPFLPEAAGVMEKNPNIAADLSGLLEGITPLDEYFEAQAGYIFLLKAWISYVNDPKRFLFGTDFPAVNLQNYKEFCMRLMPEKQWEDFFFNNANRIYRLGL